MEVWATGSNEKEEKDPGKKSNDPSWYRRWTGQWKQGGARILYTEQGRGRISEKQVCKNEKSLTSKREMNGYHILYFPNGLQIWKGWKFFFVYLKIYDIILNGSRGTLRISIDPNLQAMTTKITGLSNELVLLTHSSFHNYEVETTFQRIWFQWLLNSFYSAGQNNMTIDTNSELIQDNLSGDTFLLYLRLDF